MPKIRVESKMANTKLRIWANTLIVIIGISLIAKILLTTPYHEVKNYTLTEEAPSTTPLDILINLEAGVISIVPGRTFSVNGESRGRGIPTSKILGKFSQTPVGPERNRLFYREEHCGRLFKVEQHLTITIPWHRVKYLSIAATNCDVVMEFTEDLSLFDKLSITNGNGRLTLKNFTEFQWKEISDRDRFGNKAQSVSSPGNPRPLLDVSDKFEGNLQWSGK